MPREQPVIRKRVVCVATAVDIVAAITAAMITYHMNVYTVDAYG